MLENKNNFEDHPESIDVTNVIYSLLSNLITVLFGKIIAYVLVTLELLLDQTETKIKMKSHQFSIAFHQCSGFCSLMKNAVVSCFFNLV